MLSAREFDAVAAALEADQDPQEAEKAAFYALVVLYGSNTETGKTLRLLLPYNKLKELGDRISPQSYHGCACTY